MSKFITDEILGEREKRILGSFVSLVNPTSRSQSVKKDQIILKDNKYYSVIKVVLLTSQQVFLMQNTLNHLI